MKHTPLAHCRSYFKHKPRAILAASIALLLPAVFQCTLKAQTTWLLSPASGDWNTAGNWTPATVPNSSTAVVVFSASNQTSVSISAPSSVGSITFDNASSAYTISANGNTLTINGSGITNSSATTQNFSVNGGAFLFKGTSNAGSNTNYTMTGSGIVAFSGKSSAGSATYTITNGALEFRGNATGGTARIIDNSTMFILSDAGGVSIGSLEGSGTVVIGSSGGSGAAAQTLTVGSNNTNTIFSGVIQEGGGAATPATASLKKIGSGTLTLTGANSYTGSTTIARGTISEGFLNALPTVTDLILGSANSAITGTLDLNGNNQTVNSIALAVGNTAAGGNTITSATGPATFTVSSTTTNSIFAGAITGPLALVKDGAGTTLTLTANNTYANGATITAGTLQIGNGGAAGRITGKVTDNGTLAFNRSDSVTFAGVISGAGTVTQVGTGTTILTGNSTYTGGTAITAGTLQLGNGGTSGRVTGKIVNDGTLAFNRSDSLTYGGVISGSGAVTQIGTGTTILTAANTYTGGTTITAGTLQLGNGGTTGSIKGKIANDGALVFNQSDSLTLGGVISGAGTVTQLGTGTTTLTGNNTYTGGTTITAGTLQLGNAGTTGSINGDVTNNAALAFNRSNASTFSGDISGSGSLTQLGAGTTILTGTNSYSGGTTIASGKLQIGKGGATGSITGNVTDNDTLAFNRSDTVTFGGVISGTGSVRQAGPGTTILTGANTYAMGTTISAGTLQLGNGGTSGSIQGRVTDNASLVFNRSDTVISRGKISGSGSVAQVGTGTTILTNANPYLGGTTISAGTLQIGDGGDTGRIEGAVTNNASLVFNRSDSVDMGVEISGTGSVTQLGSGTTALTKVNSYTGGTAITAGTLQIGNGGTSGRLTGDVTDNATFAFNRKGTLTFAGNVSGSGSVAQLGAGTTVLTGSNTYQGGTVISAGKLLAGNTAGSATGSGRVTVEAGGTLGGDGTIAGPVTLNSGGTISPGAGTHGSTLHAASVTWNGGSTVSLGLGATSDLLALTGALTKGSAGDYLLKISDAGGIGDQSDYTLATFGSTNFKAGDFTLALPDGYSAALFKTASSLNLALAFAATGPVIQNTGPVGIPLIADFTVSGAVTTGGPSDDNTIKSLIFTPGGTLTIFNTLTLTSGNVTTTGGDSVITGGTLSGPAGLHFDVNGNLFLGGKLIGDATLTGGGSLYLDGALYGNLQVLLGTLGGNGSIFGNVTNAGIVSPGHSPGALQINGNYTQSPSGLLKIEIGGTSAGQFDLLKVGGAASLDGGLQIVRLNNLNLKRGDKITFLTAGNGVIGRFAMVSNEFTSDTILLPTVVYGATSVDLDMVQGSFAKFAEGEGLSPNATSVARALDRVVSDSRANALIDYLDSRSLENLPGDFAKIDPEQLTSIFTVGVALATVQSLNLQRRTDDIRAGSSGFSAAGLAVNGTGPGYSGSFGAGSGVAGPVGPDDKESREVTHVAPAERRWGAFLSGTGQWLSVGDTENARGYDFQSGGFTLGVDYKVCPNFAFGMSFGYTGTTADLTDRGRVWVNGGKIGVYATTFAGGWYADAAVNGGYNGYDTRRSGLQGDARGSTDGGEVNALFGTGYDFKKGALTFGPTATFNYTYVGLNGFTESGSLAPLDIHGAEGESLRTAFGVKASYEWKIGGVVIKPEIRAAWQHEFGDTTYALESNFANGAGRAFTVDGPKIGRDGALLSAGVAILFSERCMTYFYYDGEVGRSDYHSSSVTGGLQVAF